MLAYAQQHPNNVAALVLTAVTTTTEREVQWITRDVGRLFPAEWARFRAGVPQADRDGNLAEAYSRLLGHTDPEVRHQAALDWCRWKTRISISGRSLALVWSMLTPIIECASRGW